MTDPHKKINKYMFDLYLENGIKTETSKQEKINEAFKIALDLRKLEIELYWKRTGYFWLFCMALFTFYGAAFYLIVSDKIDAGAASRTSISPIFIRLFLILSSLLGVLVSFIWILVNKGSKFWQENWELHVDYLSKYLVGNLFSYLPGDKIKEKFCKTLGFNLNESAFSVSKANLLINYLVFYSWAIVFTFSVYLVLNCDFKIPFSLGIVLSIIVSAVSLFGFLSIIHNILKTDVKKIKDRSVYPPF